MKPLSLLYFILYTMSVTAFCGCSEKQPPAAETIQQNDTPLVIDIADVKTVLPQAGNVDLVEMHCVPCHSLRYIEMQPQLSYSAWEKLVDKMIHAYGAPIRDSVTRKDIINYLYAIKGLEEQ